MKIYALPNKFKCPTCHTIVNDIEKKDIKVRYRKFLSGRDKCVVCPFCGGNIWLKENSF